MKGLALATLLLLGGCRVATAPVGAPTVNHTLLALSYFNIPTACGIVSVAEGYFQQLKPRISSVNRMKFAKAAARANEICIKPPADAVPALRILGAEWVIIQSATKVR